MSDFKKKKSSVDEPPEQSSKVSSKRSVCGKQASKTLKRKDTEDIESSSPAPSKKSKSIDKKKSQEALTAAIVMPDKPNSPLSSYHIFFQMEREFIMHEISEGRKPMEDPMIKDAMVRVAESMAEEGGSRARTRMIRSLLVTHHQPTKKPIRNQNQVPRIHLRNISSIPTSHPDTHTSVSTNSGTVWDRSKNSNYSRHKDPAALSNSKS